jgi:hypothetical protein
MGVIDKLAAHHSEQAALNVERSQKKVVKSITSFKVMRTEHQSGVCKSARS